jgi:hypothetical protein
VWRHFQKKGKKGKGKGEKEREKKKREREKEKEKERKKKGEKKEKTRGEKIQRPKCAVDKGTKDDIRGGSIGLLPKKKIVVNYLTDVS